MAGWFDKFNWDTLLGSSKNIAMGAYNGQAAEFNGPQIEPQVKAPDANISDTLLTRKQPEENTAKSDSEDWQHVFATREGKVGGKTAAQTIIKENDIFIALPSRSVLGKTVEIYNPKNGKRLVTRVGEVGPWDSRDPYWENNSRPQAESGKNISGDKTNKAGIDLSNEAFRQLGMKDNGHVYWRFIDEDE